MNDATNPETRDGIDDATAARTRRDLLRLAGTGAAVAAGGLLLRTTPVAAADGGTVTLGSTGDANNHDTTATTITQDTGGGIAAFQGVQSGASTAISGLYGAIKGFGASSMDGVDGYAPGLDGYGVVGKTDSGYGVVGAASTGIDFGALGTGRLYLTPTATAGHPTTGSYATGEAIRDNFGVLWLCVVGGTPGTWEPAVMGGMGTSLYENVMTTQAKLTGNDGSTWVDMGVAYTVTPNYNAHARCTGNADLWTDTGGYNQDIGIWISGGTFGVAPGTLLTWKESGGFAGTFSPNAAYVEGIAYNLVAGTSYTIKLRWKANKAMPGGASIYAGAGPINSAFSPTRLIIQLVPR